MLERIGRWIQTLPDLTAQRALRNVIEPVADRLSCQSRITAGLVIKAGASALVKTGAAAWYGTVQGKLVTIAAATDMPALVGTVTADLFNVFCFFVDIGGTVTVAMGTEATTLVGVTFPQIPVGKTMIGFIIVNPTGTGNFVGGTTALDDATVVPTVVYMDAIGAFDPSVLL